jgi:hypothetical protein
VHVLKSSDPERLNNICVANGSDQAAYCSTWKYSHERSGIFRHRNLCTFEKGNIAVYAHIMLLIPMLV